MPIRPGKNVNVLQAVDYKHAEDGAGQHVSEIADEARGTMAEREEGKEAREHGGGAGDEHGGDLLERRHAASLPSAAGASSEL